MREMIVRYVSYAIIDHLRTKTNTSQEIYRISTIVICHHAPLIATSEATPAETAESGDVYIAFCEVRWPKKNLIIAIIYHHLSKWI